MEMQDHDCGDSCDCMEESKESVQIRTTLSHANPLNETRDTSAQQPRFQPGDLGNSLRLTNSSALCQVPRSGLTVREIHEQGILAMLTRLGLAEDMSSADLKKLGDVQYVAEVAAQCTEHMQQTE